MAEPARTMKLSALLWPSGPPPVSWRRTAARRIHLMKVWSPSFVEPVEKDQPAG
jgi:hypothetical protein